MIGLLRRGDDGLTDRQRRRMAEEYARTLGATPSADLFARARARHMTSRVLATALSPAGRGAGTTSERTSPALGVDAAAGAVRPQSPPKATPAACQTSGRTPLSGGSRSSAGGACGRDAQASPAVPCLACGADSAPGDDLCRSHGGMTDGIERHAAMRAA